MLSIAKLSAGQCQYYMDLAQTDYYTAGGEPPGIWVGQAAEHFGFLGHENGGGSMVDNKVFAEMFDGFLGGKKLVQNAGKEERCPGWDLTFSAPKSVSTLWSQLDGSMAQKVQAAHQTAVEKALAYIERECAWTRRGKGGHLVEKAGLAFAVFEHGTSRAGDPQLHSHSIMLNVALREDGTTGALETRRLYVHKMAGGALYRAELAFQLEKELGLQIDRKDFGFEVLGVSGELMGDFSKRRKEIEDRLEMLGEEGAVASERVALQSRSNKEMISRQQLKIDWRKSGEEHEWSQAEAAALIDELKALERDEKTFSVVKDLCAKNAIEKVVENRATFAERDMVRFVAEEAQGRSLSGDEVLELVKETLEHSQELRDIGMIRNDFRFTTQEIWRLEKDLMKRTGEMSEGEGLAVDPAIMDQVIVKRPTIKPEQKDAVESILTGKTGDISLVTGDAGTGKTFMLDAVRNALKLSGYEVRGATLTGKAAQELQEGAGIESSTIHRLLNQLGDSDSPVLNAKSCLVIDEAAMVDTRKLHQIVTACQETGAKLILVGDGKQLQAIEIGGGFQALGDLVGTSRLQEIVRQPDPKDRKAVREVSQGEAKSALRYLLDKGNLAIAPNRRDAKRLLMNGWSMDGTERPEDHLILASRNVDVFDLNRGAQHRRREMGTVGGESMTVGDTLFFEKDRILFTRNHYGIGVRNGTLGTIRYIDPELKLLSVVLDDDRELTVAAGEYDHLKLGYAITTHKAQGITVANTYVLTDEMMQNRESTYVQFSRAKNNTAVFTTRAEVGQDLTDLSDRMSRSREKELAIEEAKRVEQQLGMGMSQ